MCLIVKEGCKIEIAEKDITAYKCINEYENYWTGVLYRSPSFAYNKLQKAKHLCLDAYADIDHLQIERFGNGIIIDEGFHSLINKDGYFFAAFKKAICIIPKGSEYCFGKDDEVVSDQIIVFKTKEDYDRYIASKVSSN
jgi:hypothetical protein